MQATDDGHAVRLAAFRYLDHLQVLHGDALPWSALIDGFEVNGQRVPLIGAAGIWKPRVLDIPISIATSPLSLCKIHHAAFDSNILGIRPNDLTLEIREDILHEVDGPMLKHGLQDHHGGHLSVARSAHERPDKERLELRYDEFRKAS